MQAAFQKRKIERAIADSGKYFVLYRPGLNTYGEPDESIEVVRYTVRGLYHTNVSHVSVQGADGTRTQKQETPAFLVLTTALEEIMPEVTPKVKLDDMVEFYGMLFRVTGVTDPYMDGYATDISLELVV